MTYKSGGMLERAEYNLPLTEEAYYHLEKGHTSYTSNWGLIELREEIAKYMERYNLYYNPKNEILITVGASEGVDAVLRAILNPGDEIIVVQPFDVFII